jgi:hypothetical protein
LRDQTRLSTSGYNCQPNVNLFHSSLIGIQDVAILRLPPFAFSEDISLYAYPKGRNRIGGKVLLAIYGNGSANKMPDQAVPFCWTTNSAVDISMGLRSSVRPVTNILLLPAMRNRSAVEKRVNAVENAHAASVFAQNISSSACA